MNLLDFGGAMPDSRTNAAIELYDKIVQNPKIWIAVNVIEMSINDSKDLLVKFCYAGSNTVLDNILISPQVLGCIEEGGWYIIRIEWVQRGTKRYKKWQTVYMSDEKEVIEEMGKPCAEWHQTI